MEQIRSSGESAQYIPVMNTDQTTVINSNIKRLKYIYSSIPPRANIQAQINELIKWCDHPLAYHEVYIPYLSQLLFQLAKQSIEIPNDPKIFYRLLDYHNKLTAWVAPILIKINQLLTPQSNPYSIQDSQPPILQISSNRPSTHTNVGFTNPALSTSTSLSMQTNLPAEAQNTVYQQHPHSFHNPTISQQTYIPPPVSGKVLATQRIDFGFAVTNDHLKYGDTNTMIHLRCCRANDSSEKHEWPINLHRVLVNGIEINITKKKYERTSDNLLRTIGVNMPAFIRPYLTQGKSTITITFLPGPAPTEYVFKVESFVVFSPENARNYVRLRPKLGDKEFRNLVNDLFNESDDDCMMVVETMPLKLTCPLTLKRMTTPVRNLNCKHLNCFDLETWINSYSAGIIFVNLTCPICSKHIHLNFLCLDMAVKKILDFTDESVTTVIVKPDSSCILENGQPVIFTNNTSGGTISVDSSNSRVSAKHNQSTSLPPNGSQTVHQQTNPQTNTAANLTKNSNSQSSNVLNSNLLPFLNSNDPQNEQFAQLYSNQLQPIPMDTTLLSKNPRDFVHWKNAAIITRLWEEHDKSDDENVRMDPPTKLVSSDYENATDINNIIASVFSDVEDDSTVVCEMHEWEYVNYLSDDEL
ncbi:SUMO ligase siz1 [Boothiomyces sp. JEL0838]|nr:SUMO ligase siz1 [Boothiomyces sp. JEL0838]